MIKDISYSESNVNRVIFNSKKAASVTKSSKSDFKLNSNISLISYNPINPNNCDGISDASSFCEFDISDDDLNFSASGSERNKSLIRSNKYGFTGGKYFQEDKDLSSKEISLLRLRENKWKGMLDHWEHYMRYRYQKVKERCRKGIPQSFRALAWQYLCGAFYLLRENADLFHQTFVEEGDLQYIDEIKKDLHRQFPYHELFSQQGGQGQQDLFAILKAFTILRPKIGYCQALAPIAAVLLMQMPAEPAFWCLISICDNYLPNYFGPGLEMVQIDGDVFYSLLKKKLPHVYKHLKKQSIPPSLCVTEWFMCIYTRTLPFDSVLRVLDMFFCEGVKVLFKVALLLFKLSLGTPSQLKKCPTMYETLTALHSINPKLLCESNFSKELMKLQIKAEDIEQGASNNSLVKNDEQLRSVNKRL